MNIPIKPDQEGFLGRECPQAKCEGYFKVKPGTGLKGDNLPCHCPYCGHTADNNHFWTKEQIEYAQSMAMRQVTEAFAEDLRSLEFDLKPKGAFGIGISMKLEPGSPSPIRYYREKKLETHVTCESCTLEYAVFGVFGYCPDCRRHNSLEILRRNLALTRKEVALAESQEDPALRRHLLEDALENCISAFDGFARETCRVHSTGCATPAKAGALSFQNLPRAASHVLSHFGVDLPEAVGPAEWSLLHSWFLKRHLIAHRAGVVDQKYLDESSDGNAVLGRLIDINSVGVLSLADAVERLGEKLIDLLPSA